MLTIFSLSFLFLDLLLIFCVALYFLPCFSQMRILCWVHVFMKSLCGPCDCTQCAPCLSLVLILVRSFMCGCFHFLHFIFSTIFDIQVMLSQITSFSLLNIGNGKTVFLQQYKCLPINYCRKWCSHIIFAFLDFSLYSFFSTVVWPVVGRAVSLSSELLVFLFCCLS